MTALRERMIDAMAQRGFSPRTHQSYLRAIVDLARYTRTPPDRLDSAQLVGYFHHLVQERHLAPASCRLHREAVRFLYVQVLHRDDLALDIPLPKRPQRIPELLSPSEVRRLLTASPNAKHRMLLATCYGAGLRVSEVVRLRVRDIDGEQGQLRIVQGKGRQDRLVPIGATLLDELRSYWRRYRPKTWLFPGSPAERHLCITSAQRAYRQALARAGIDKVGGIHALRHAYATHQLAAGMPLHILQRLLGHRDLSATQRYLHWVPSALGEDGRHPGVADLLAGLTDAAVGKPPASDPLRARP